MSIPNAIQKLAIRSPQSPEIACDVPHRLTMPIYSIHASYQQIFSKLEGDCTGQLWEVCRRIVQFVLNTVLYIPSVCLMGVGRLISALSTDATQPSSQDPITPSKAKITVQTNLEDPLLKSARVFICSAPYETEHTGDVDYALSLQRSLTKNRISCEYLTGNTQHRGAPLYDAQKLTDPASPKRNEAVANIENYILSFEGPKILHLQLRVPESGCLFTPEDLQRFREKGIKIVITCHEWTLNNHRRDFQTSAHTYFESADHVIFLNQKDAQGAGAKKTYSISAVPPTIAIDCLPNPAEVVARKVNVLAFGMLRPYKGFEQAIQLAELMKKQGLKNAKVIIAGRPMDRFFFIRSLFNRAFRLPLDTIRALEDAWDQDPQKLTQFKRAIAKVQSELGEGALPVEFHLDLNEGEMHQLVSRCKYAYKPDNKGFANNASAIINMLAQGCITFAKWGIVTSPDFLKGGRFENALILTEMQEGLVTQSPSPEFVLHKIMERESELDQVANRSTVETALAAVRELFNPEKIAHHVIGVYQSVVASSI